MSCQQGEGQQGEGQQGEGQQGEGQQGEGQQQPCKTCVNQDLTLSLSPEENGTRPRAIRQEAYAYPALRADVEAYAAAEDERDRRWFTAYHTYEDAVTTAISLEAARLTRLVDVWDGLGERPQFTLRLSEAQAQAIRDARRQALDAARLAVEKRSALYAKMAVIMRARQAA